MPFGLIGTENKVWCRVLFCNMIKSNFIFLLNVQGDTKNWELLKNPTKIEEIQEKKFIDRN